MYRRDRYYKNRRSEKPAILVPLILNNIKNFEPDAGKRKFEQGRQEALQKEQELLDRFKQLPDGEQKAKETKRMIELSTLDKASNPVILKDTLWIKQRSDGKRKVSSNPRIDGLLASRKAAFDSVVSKSAFLYVFRPGKFAESLVSYTLFLNDVPICETANKASYIVRLSKEGQKTFVAKVKKQETSITLDVKSGYKYFLHCELPWSLAPKPKLTEVSKEEAQPYFDKIK